MGNITVMHDKLPFRSESQEHGRSLTRSERVSAAIGAAVSAVLAERGMSGLTMDLVADRAGVGKAALYRRYRSREAMVVDVFCTAAEQEPALHDTGTLHGDLGAFLEQTVALLQGTIGLKIVPELFAAAHRDPDVGAALRGRLLRVRREAARAMLQRAVERHEISADADPDFLLDLVAGGLYWRIFVAGTLIEHRDVDALVEALVVLGNTTPAAFSGSTWASSTPAR